MIGGLSIVLIFGSCAYRFHGPDPFDAINDLMRGRQYITKPCAIQSYPRISISAEFCNEPYLIDTKSQKLGMSDQPNAKQSYRLIYISFTIPNYKKTYNADWKAGVSYYLYITECYDLNAKVVKIIPISYDNPEITWKYPSEESKNPYTDFSGTIRTAISWNAQYDYELENSGNKIYYFTVKTIYPVINPANPDHFSLYNPDPCTTPIFCKTDQYGRGENATLQDVYSQTISLVNHQTGYDGKEKREKIMNLYLFGNGEDCDITKYKWESTTRKNSFAETFTLVWAGKGYSDVHVIPNFLPNQSSSPNYTSPKNNPIPEFLVSKDGYIVLSKTELQKLKEDDYPTSYDKIDALMVAWKNNFMQYLNWVHQNPNAFVGKLSKQDLPNFACDLNEGALVTVNGFKIYEVNENSNSVTLSTEQWILNGTDTVSMDAINKSFPSLGDTYVFNGCKSGHTGVSIIYRERHLEYKKLPAQGFCISTAMHELVHLWNNSETMDFSLPDDIAQHAAYAMGNDSKYCLFGAYPSLGDDVEKFYENKIRDMKFSDGVEQRMTNTIIFKQK